MVDLSKRTCRRNTRRRREAVIGVIALAILALLVLAALCSIAGWTADSRDTRFRLWPLAGSRALSKHCVSAEPSPRVTP